MMDTFAFECGGKRHELSKVGQLSVVIGETAADNDKYRILINADGIYGEMAEAVLKVVKDVLEPRIGKLGDAE